MQNKGREIMYRVSEEFHEKYFTMYDHMVRIFFKNGTEKTGLFNDEFYEDSSILVSCEVITRQGGENRFQIIWPDQVEFDIGIRENFCFKRDDKLYFSEWHEDPDYREEINIREYPAGKLIEKISGAEMILPDGQSWILR